MSGNQYFNLRLNQQFRVPNDLARKVAKQAAAVVELMPLVHGGTSEFLGNHSLSPNLISQIIVVVEPRRTHRLFVDMTTQDNIRT